MQGFTHAGQSQNQTTWKRVVSWVLFNYFAIVQCIRHIINTYGAQEKPFKDVTCPPHRPLSAKPGNILYGHCVPPYFVFLSITQKELEVKYAVSDPRQGAMAAIVQKNPRTIYRYALIAPEVIPSIAAAFHPASAPTPAAVLMVMVLPDD
jgi:hypothetical protein